MANKEETCVFLDHLGEPKTAKVQMKYKKEAGVVKALDGRCVHPVLKILTVLLIVLWLLGLTVIREFQLNSLRKETASLRLDVDALNNKLMGYDILEQLNKFENEFRDDERAKTSWDNMVDEDDEEYLKDNSYADSLEDDDGDFLGETMEAHLKPKSQTDDDEDEDDYAFDDNVSTGDEELSEENFQMKKVMRIPKEDIEDESEILNRSKREIVAETPDGVPIMDEPYSVARAKNQSRVLPQPENIVEILKREHNSKELFSGWDSNQRSINGEQYRKKPLKKYEEMDSSTVSSSQVFTRPSRVMMTSGERSRPLRKFHVVRRPMLRSGPGGEHEYAPTTVENKPKRRRKNRPDGRQRSAAMSKEFEPIEDLNKKLVAAHFDGDTSGYSVGGHEHFAGNGRLRHLHDVPYTAWTPASWLTDMGMTDDYLMQDGSISIHESGLYFVYAQVYFHDAHDTNAYRVYRNNNGLDEILMQCTKTTHSPATMDKANTCYSAGIFMLNNGDLLTIKNLGSLRYSIMQKGMSFFGFFKLGDNNLKGMISRVPRSN